MATAARQFDFSPYLLNLVKHQVQRLLSAEVVFLGSSNWMSTAHEWRHPARWKSAYVSSSSRIGRRVPSRKLAMAFATLLWCMILAVAISFAAALLAAFPALLLGALSGYYALAVLQFFRIRSLAYGLTTGAVLFTFNGRELELTQSAAQLRKFCSPLWERSVAAASAGITSALALITLQTRTKAFEFLFRVGPLTWAETALAWSGPILISLWFVTGAGVTGYFERQIVSRIQGFTTKANLELRKASELEGYLLALNVSGWSLRNDPAQRYQRAVREYFASHSSELVMDPASGVAVIQALKTLAQQEVRQTQAAVQQYQNALMQFRELRGYARAVQETALKKPIEMIGDRLTQLRKMMELQDFTGVAELLQTLQQEMQSLDQQLMRAQQARIDSAYVSQVAAGRVNVNPYERLGISRDATTEQIRRLRNKLVQIYHPDALDGSPNASRMAEINAAVDQILKWRGER